MGHVEHGPLPYLLSLPRDSAAHPHPVLVFLHGYDEGPPTRLEAGLTRHGPLKTGNNVPALEKFIVVAPQMPVRGDCWTQFGEQIGEVLRNVQRNHCGDPRRSYLTGFSFGANGVFDIAQSGAAVWAALWAVDPTRVPASRMPAPVWLSFGEIARHRKNDFVAALWLEPADDGGTAGRAVYDDSGADHVGAASDAYANERIYAWLLTKSLP